jgi:hypothetical protein
MPYGIGSRVYCRVKLKEYLMNKDKKYNCIVTPSCGEPRAITVTYERTRGNCHVFSGGGWDSLSTSLEGHSINYLVDLDPSTLLPMPEGRMTPSCVLLQKVRFETLVDQLKATTHAERWLALSYAEQAQWLRDRGVRPYMKTRECGLSYLERLEEACVKLLVKPVVDSRGTELSIGDEVVVLCNPGTHCFEVGEVCTYIERDHDEPWAWLKSGDVKQVLRPEDILKIV